MTDNCYKGIIQNIPIEEKPLKQLIRLWLSLGFDGLYRK
jgi:hypothetical protein